MKSSDWLIDESGSRRIKAGPECDFALRVTLEAATSPSRIAGRILPTDIPVKDSRVYRHDEFVDRFQARAAALKCGDPGEPDTSSGRSSTGTSCSNCSITSSGLGRSTICRPVGSAVRRTAGWAATTASGRSKHSPPSTGSRVQHEPIHYPF
jgi:hypothetical protein